MKTTLNKIKAFEPCKDSWKKLLTFLNKKEADDEELSLLTILESNGLEEAIWALRAVDGFEKEKRLMACDFAESVVHLAKDERSVNAIKVSRAYANGLATEEELNAARAAARAADLDSVGCASSAASNTTRASASYSAFAASYSARAEAGCAETEKQIEFFKKYVK